MNSFIESDSASPVQLRSDLLGGGRDRPALCVAGGGGEISHGNLRALVLGLAEVLRSRSVAGGRVGLFLPAGPEFGIALLGGLSAGAAALPIDPSSKGDHLKQLLLALRPSALLTSSSLARRLDGVAEQINVVTIDWNAPRQKLGVQSKSWGETFEVDGSPAPDGSPPVGVVADLGADALLIATSGTTGAPKLVRLSHRAIRYNMAAHLTSLGLDRPYVALQALGANYSYGLIASFLSTLSIGGTVVIPRFLDRRHIIDAAVEGGTNVCLGTPALFRLLIEGSSNKDLDAISRLEIIGIGGDHCPAHHRKTIANALPASRCFVTYGLTEAGPRVSTLPPEDFLERGESVGVPLPGVEVEVRDAEGRSCQPGEVGSLVVRTPSLMSGYLLAGNSEPPPPPPRNSWYPTGDLASLDANGYLTLHGRADRQTKFRGRRFNPAVVERCIESHPSVVSAQVAVDPAADRLVATARVRPGFDGALSRELLAHCRRNLPNALVPSGIECVPEEGYYFKNRRVYGSA